MSYQLLVPTPKKQVLLTVLSRGRKCSLTVILSSRTDLRLDINTIRQYITVTLGETSLSSEQSRASISWRWWSSRSGSNRFPRHLGQYVLSCHVLSRTFYFFPSIRRKNLSRCEKWRGSTANVRVVLLLCLLSQLSTRVTVYMPHRSTSSMTIPFSTSSIYLGHFS